MSKKKKNNDTTLKLLALVMAILLWSFVMKEVNPVITKDFTIPIDLKNIDYLSDNNLILLSEKENNVKITIEGEKSEIDRLRLEKLTANINLEELEAGKTSLPINISPLTNAGNVRLLSYEPRELVVEIDELVTENLDVVIETSGDMMKDYILGEISIDPTSIEVTGPKSHIVNINKAVAQVDLEGANKSFNKSTIVDLLDIDGRPISNLKKKPSMVNVSVPIKKKKPVSINLVKEGELPEGYIMVEEKISPETIDVLIGDKGSDIDTVNTKPILMNDLIDKNTIRLELDLPEGVELFDKNEILKYEFTIEEDKPTVYRYSPDEIGMINQKEGFSAEVLDSVDIMIDKDILKLIDVDIKSLIKPYVDLSEVEEGENNLEVKINISDEYRKYVKSLIPISVRVMVEQDE